MGGALLAGWLREGLDPASVYVQDPTPPPRRVKNPCRMPSQLSRVEAQNMALSGVTMAGRFKIGRNADDRKVAAGQDQRS